MEDPHCIFKFTHKSGWALGKMLSNAQSLIGRLDKTQIEIYEVQARVKLPILKM